MHFHPRESLLLCLLRVVKKFDRRQSETRYFSPAAVRSILVISSTALGDTVMSTAAMVALRVRYPAARITALIHQSYVDLFRRMPELDVVVSYHGGYRRFVRTALALYKAKPDVALILHGNEPQATPLAYFSRARFLFKLPNNNPFRFLLSNHDPVITREEIGHGMTQRLQTAALIDASVVGARMCLPVDGDAIAAVDAFLSGHGITPSHTVIGLQVGASSRSRMWPAEKFVELAHGVAARYPQARFVLSGSAAESAYCHEIARAIDNTAVVAADAVSVAHIPTLVRRMRLLVSGDTGTMHVAVAVDTPVVALFAVSNPKMSGPAYDLDRHVVIHRPCADPGIRSKSDDQTCIGQIPVADVLAAVETILGRKA